jgi:catechol 2,3-dioxygenase-like lactoylglutathione lyase family enzyme
MADAAGEEAIMRITVTSVLVDDQEKALRFYTDVLGSRTYTSFAVEDVNAEYERLRALGVRFTQEPAQMGPTTTAVLDDTCGNLIQIASMA